MVACSNTCPRYAFAMFYGIFLFDWNPTHSSLSIVSFLCSTKFDWMHEKLTTWHRMFQHGSPFNVPAGSGVNLDKVIAHYRKQYLEEEVRKAKRLAASQ